jgi:hypothetical protein
MIQFNTIGNMTKFINIWDMTQFNTIGDMT